MYGNNLSIQIFKCQAIYKSIYDCNCKYLFPLYVKNDYLKQIISKIKLLWKQHKTLKGFCQSWCYEYSW